MNRTLNYFVLVLLLIVFSCSKIEEYDIDQTDERLSGGIQTVFDESSGAFGNAFPVMYGNNSMAHNLGDKDFNATFVTAPALVHSGLGPIFNAVSCVRCHVNDGKGKPPLPGQEIESLLMRISLIGEDIYGNPNSVPEYGGQIQNFSIFNTIAEASVKVNYTDKIETFPDGSSFSLRVPVYTISNHYRPFSAGVLTSPRIAQSLHGLGLLEAVSEYVVLEKEDIMDSDQDGISGKANYVWDVKSKMKKLGRFGWKANQPSLRQQTAAAYNGDMGITTSLFSTESAHGQLQEDRSTDDPEISDSTLDLVTFYVSSLAVPARRNTTHPDVIAGKKIFKQLNCNGCHRESMRTRTDMTFKEVSNQVIRPYTDMLLHDMGDALADHRPDGKADGNEWRTAPLWGLGLQQKVNGHTFLLHDGRARGIVEAILWHGGEAQSSRDAYKKLPKADRDQLLKFLESL